MTRKQLVYIAGSGHSGSTLLDMLLGGHDQMSDLGEVHRLSMAACKSSKPFLCTCGESVRECFFWNKVAQELQALLDVNDPDILEKHPTTCAKNAEVTNDGEYLRKPQKAKRYPISLNRVAMVIGSKKLQSLLSLVSEDVRRHKAIIRNSLLVYEAVRRAWDTPIIIDSTKNPARLKGLYLAADDGFHVLHLIRDGRAVAYSRMRRTGLSITRCARIWVAEQRKLKLVLLTVPKNLITQVHYEDLATKPEQELARICRVLGIDYQPSMLRFRSDDRHSIGGNPMRFKEGEIQVRFDERWRREMRREDIETFQKIGGKVNRSYGYRELPYGSLD